MLSLVWLAIRKCSEINLFKIEILTPFKLLIFSPLPLFSALSFQILCALCNILLKISFYASPYKWALLCYTSLSYALPVLIMSPLVDSVAKYPRYLKQDTWEHKNSMKKVKWSKKKCFHTQGWLAFYWFFFFHQGKLFLKPPVYHNLSVQLKNYQAELYHIKSYCCGYIASEQQEPFHHFMLWALSTEPLQVLLLEARYEL